MPVNNPFTGFTNGGTAGAYNPGNLTTKGGLKMGLANQYNQNSQLQADTFGQKQGESSSLLGGYGSLLDSGYSPMEKSAINQSTLGGITSAYGGAQDAASRRMAATGNSAGYGSFLGANARGKAADLAGQNLQNQKAFADETLRRKMLGLQGLQQMYGVDTSFLNSLGNQQLGVLGIGNSTDSRRKGVLGNIEMAGNAKNSWI